MALSSLIFGAIGTLVETSDMQRRSFNAAFKAHNLDWDWSTTSYKGLLAVNGGKNRIRHYAQSHDVSLSEARIAALHQSKTDAFDALVTHEGLSARPGIAALIADAKAAGLTVGMASTTSSQNIDALFSAARDISRDDFDFILSGEAVKAVKPDPEIYNLASRKSQCLVSEILVIEDTPVSAKAAKDAGLAVVIYPGDMIDMTAHKDMAPIISASDVSLTGLSGYI